MINPRNRLTTTVLFALVFCASLGCHERDGEPSDSTRRHDDVERQAVDKPKSTPAKPTEESVSVTGASDDIAQSLSAATNDFTNVFTEDFAGEEGSEPGIDESLVDEEMRRKYIEDRTLVSPTLEPSQESVDASAQKYRLVYRFQPRTNLRWNVVHLVRKRISYGGQERLIETSSTTYRRWEMMDERADGKVASRHWIDRMILRQNEEGKDPVDYDSERDLVVPKQIAAFGTEKAVGVVLETFDVDPFGVMSNKKKLVAEYQGKEGDANMMAPLPDAELVIGDVWTVPYTLFIKGGDKVVRPYHVVERFRLDSVSDKYATISFKTTLVSIVEDPVVEGELAERLFTGRSLFDIELGQTVRTELNFKKTVPNAYGFASFLEYNCQVVEKLVLEETPETDENSSAERQAPAPVEQSPSETVEESVQVEQ